MSTFSSETILHSDRARQGKVPMVQHPDYDYIVNGIESLGFKVQVIKAGSSRVMAEREIHSSGETTDNYILSVVAQNSFIEFEHVVSHIEQIINRFITQGLPIFTRIMIEDNQGGWSESQNHPDLLRSWQNTVAEYHSRLLEFKRLYARGSDSKTLNEHARQLMIWSKKYYSAIGLGKSRKKVEWENQFFKDLQDLRKEVNEILAEENISFAEWETAKNQNVDYKPS